MRRIVCVMEGFGGLLLVGECMRYSPKCKEEKRRCVIYHGLGADQKRKGIVELVARKIVLREETLDHTDFFSTQKF